MTLSLEGLRAFENDANVRAMLAVIAAKESGGAFDIINGGARFTDFSRHPYQNIPTTQGGRAAGCYQFLGTTWQRLCDRYEFPDFSPDSQTLGAIALIQGRGALDDVIHGRFEDAVRKLRPEWTSLPGASESRGDWTMDKARALFVSNGGRLATDDLIQPAAPVDDHSPVDLPPVQPPENRMPLPVLALISLFGPMLAELLPTVARAFSKGTDTPQKIEAASKIIEVVTRTTAQPTLQGAIEAMKSSPEVLTEVRNAVVTDKDIQGLLEIGGGIEAARAANLEMQQAPRSFLYNPAFWITILLLMFPIMLMVDVFWVHAEQYNAELRTQIVTSILGVILVISGYWLGTSAGSVRKTDIIAQQGASK
jgi:muramidase (phage lysozyme)